MLNLSKYLTAVPQGPFRRRLRKIKNGLSLLRQNRPSAGPSQLAPTGPKIRLLEERQVGTFQIVEQVGGSRPDKPSHVFTPLLSPAIHVEGTDPHKLRLVHQPFDIGVTTVQNALMWAVPPAVDLQNAAQEGKWLRYDGAHMIVSLDGYTFSDCLFRNNGIPRTVSIQPNGDLHIPNIESSEIKHLDGQYVLLGDIHNHFGHVLVESVNRLWYLSRMTASERGRSRFVFFNTWGAMNDSLIVPFLGLYGITIDNVSIVDRQTRFESLIVPSPAQRPFHGWDIYYSQTMEAFYAELRDRFLARYKPSLTRSFDKIYLSRARFVAARQGQRVLEEAALVEQRFRDAGFEIVHPETLAFEDQLYLANGAREIAGPAGSAHHIAAFAGNLERQTIITHPRFFLPPTDASFTMLKGAELTYYFGSIKDAHIGSLEADWTIVPKVFDEWFSKRYGRRMRSVACGPSRHRGVTGPV